MSDPVAMPGERHGHRIETVRGGLVACGGFGNTDVADSRGMRATWWLADGASEWRRRADMPTPRAFFGSAAVDDSVFAIGGGVDRYDVRSGTWQTSVGPGVLPTSHFGTAVTGGTAWILGGYPVEHSGFFEVDVERGVVERREPPPGFAPGDHFHFVLAVGGELHVIGGLDGATFRPRREHWVAHPAELRVAQPFAGASAGPGLRPDRGPRWVRRDGVWRAMPPPPEGLWAKFGGSAVVGDRAYLFGGFGHFVFDAATGQWSERAAMPYGLVMPAVVVRGRSVWIVGGERLDASGKVLLEYRVDDDRWIDHLP